MPAPALLREVARQAARQATRRALAFAIALFPVAAALAQATPPGGAIRVLVPNTPGSAADITARVVGTRLAEELKQTVLVENRPGAGGIVAADAVAKAAPDGHTLLLGADGPITILPNLQPALPYKPQSDLVPVASLGETDFVLVAHPRHGFKTLQDFLAAARRQPGRLNYASAGNGSPQQFAMEVLKQQANVFVTHIPYRGGPLGMADVVAGQVDVMFIAVGPALPHIQSGRLAALAVGGEKPHPLRPGVPTVDQTCKGFRAGTWFGLFAPAGTPAPVVDGLASAVRHIVATPAVQAELARQGVRATGYPSAHFGGLLRTESQKFAALVKATGLKAE